MPSLDRSSAFAALCVAGCSTGTCLGGTSAATTLLLFTCVKLASEVAATLSLMPLVMPLLLLLLL
eukprot:CAMPEP_0172835536 /NCGR_PEP_ID=MMETSP1075-20121228/25839_1 /TAXON_ID=2916 /ORGANISM="Ceratium fusus, Strain PA161109" /LENGTH=64 /DNA_ID=CAMNT_0013678603 /DNA_START=34 /DNA_END=225 /DNA_ORIENTATION=-